MRVPVNQRPGAGVAYLRQLDKAFQPCRFALPAGGHFALSAAARRDAAKLHEYSDTADLRCALLQSFD